MLAGTWRWKPWTHSQSRPFTPQRKTQASAGQPGTPYRFTFNKKSKAVTVQALSSFSKALVPPKGNSFDLEETIIGV
jgi:hypothetical protein